jgi:hypothetical protein
MSCDCHGASLPLGAATAIVKKKPCGPCAQAAAQIASTIPEAEGGTMRVAGASDDLFTVQAFLQSLTNGVAPTEPALSQAQAAAGDLAISLAVQDARSQPGMVTMKTFSVGLMVVGALAAGAGVAYLLHNPRARR